MESGLLVRSAKVYALHLLPIPARVILRKVYVNDHFVGWQLLFEGPERSVLMVYVVNVCGKPRFQFNFKLLVKISQCCCPALFDFTRFTRFVVGSPSLRVLLLAIAISLSFVVHCM